MNNINLSIILRNTTDKFWRFFEFLQEVAQHIIQTRALSGKMKSTVEILDYLNENMIDGGISYGPMSENSGSSLVSQYFLTQSENCFDAHPTKTIILERVKIIHNAKLHGVYECLHHRKKTKKQKFSIVSFQK